MFLVSTNFTCNYSDTWMLPDVYCIDSANFIKEIACTLLSVVDPEVNQ